MSRTLVVDQTGQGVRVGLLHHDRLIEVDIAAQSDRVGAVCLGRIRTVANNLDGAFVDCGLGEDAFLNARDARALSGARRGTPIGEQVTEGQAVLVQVRREVLGDKGPRVSADIALPGICLMHRPRNDRIELSAELARSDDAKSQQARGEALFPAGGFTLSMPAVQVSDQELLVEAERLRETWANLAARAEAARPPAMVESAQAPLQRGLLASFSPDLERIVFGDRILLIAARRWLEQCLPPTLASFTERLEHLPDAFEAMGAAQQLEEALGRVVELAGGGSLIIEPTAALTAIDVNGAGRPLETNLEAVGEVARQLRLRRIGGIVVIDFVDLERKRDRARLEAALCEAFADDPAAVQLYPISPLGLVELSRQRTGPSLAERLGRAAPTEECLG